MVDQLLSGVARLGSKRFLFIWLEKIFLSFKLFTTDPQEKSCLPNSFRIFQMVIQEILNKCYLQCLSQSEHLQACKTSDFFLLFNTSSKFSMILTTLRFTHSSSMNTNLGKSSKFSVSFISTPSSSSSSITTFSGQWSSSIKSWYFFENKTRKIKQVNIWELSLFNFISYIFVSLALSKNL